MIESADQAARCLVGGSHSSTLRGVAALPDLQMSYTDAERFDAESAVLHQVIRAKSGRKTHDLPLPAINSRGFWDRHPKDNLYDPTDFDMGSSPESFKQRDLYWEAVEKDVTFLTPLAHRLQWTIQRVRIGVDYRFSASPERLWFGFPDGSGGLELAPTDALKGELYHVGVYVATEDPRDGPSAMPGLDPAAMRDSFDDFCFDLALGRVREAMPAVEVAAAEYLSNGGTLSSKRIEVIANTY